LPFASVFFSGSELESESESPPFLGSVFPPFGSGFFGSVFASGLLFVSTFASGLLFVSTFASPLPFASGFFSPESESESDDEPPPFLGSVFPPFGSGFLGSVFPPFGSGFLGSVFPPLASTFTSVFPDPPFASVFPFGSVFPPLGSGFFFSPDPESESPEPESSPPFLADPLASGFLGSVFPPLASGFFLP